MKILQSKRYHNINTSSSQTRELTITALFVALIAVGAFISLPIGAVSVTLQTFFVMLAGLYLSKRNAVLAVVSYLLLGIVGLPIFAGGIGGLAIFAKPSIGFLLGFIPLALISGLGKHETWQKKILFLLLGNVVLYALGFAYMVFYFTTFTPQPLGIAKILQIGVLPYLPGDAVKIALVVLVSRYESNLRRLLNGKL